MNQSSLEDLLNIYSPGCGHQMGLKNQFLKFLNSDRNVFHRSHLLGHFCASAWVVDDSCENVVLLHHKKLNFWTQPGGHCDGEQDTEQVSRKEVEEETGLVNLQLMQPGIFDLDLHRIPEFGDTPTHFHYDVRYFFRAETGAALVQNHESNKLRWFPLSEPLPTEEESILRMQKKSLACFNKRGVFMSS